MSGLTSVSEQCIRLLDAIDAIRGPVGQRGRDPVGQQGRDPVGQQGRDPVRQRGRQLRRPRNILPALMIVIVAILIDLFVHLPGAGRYPGGQAFTNLVRPQFKYSGRYQSNHWFRNAGGQQGGQPGGERGGQRGGQQGRRRGRRRNGKYLQFVLQVPRTVNPRSTLNLSFTIHGLWPTIKYNTAITYCKTRNYTAADLRKKLRGTDLPDELLQSWPNVVTPNNPNAVWSFWRYQYNKHGSCAYWRFQRLEAYFRKADDLYHRDIVQHLYDLLANNRIPRPGQVSASRYRNLVKNDGGKFPGLRCNGTGFLKEVVICYKKKATEMIDCPKRGNCTGLIEYPM